jgi:hypothetical protein
VVTDLENLSGYKEISLLRTIAAEKREHRLQLQVKVPEAQIAIMKFMDESGLGDIAAITYSRLSTNAKKAWMLAPNNDGRIELISATETTIEYTQMISESFPPLPYYEFTLSHKLDNPNFYPLIDADFNLIGFQIEKRAGSKYAALSALVPWNVISTLAVDNISFEGLVDFPVEFNNVGEVQDAHGISWQITSSPTKTARRLENENNIGACASPPSSAQSQNELLLAKGDVVLSIAGKKCEKGYVDMPLLGPVPIATYLALTYSWKGASVPVRVGRGCKAQSYTIVLRSARKLRSVPWSLRNPKLIEIRGLAMAQVSETLYNWIADKGYEAGKVQEVLHCNWGPRASDLYLLADSGCFSAKILGWKGSCLALKTIDGKQPRDYLTMLKKNPNGEEEGGGGGKNEGSPMEVEAKEDVGHNKEPSQLVFEAADGVHICYSWTGASWKVVKV